MKDRRLPPFIWQAVAVVRLLLSTYAGKRRTTALAIYLALAFCANEARTRRFEATRGELAEIAGVSKRTIDRYAREFVALGVLAVERRREGSVNRANAWSLIDPPARGGASGYATGAPESTSAERSAAPGVAQPATREQEAARKAKEAGSAPRARGVLPSVPSEVVDEVLAILSACPRLTLSTHARGQVESAIAAHPAADPVAAAREAAARAGDPSWRTTDAGRTYLHALQWRGDGQRGNGRPGKDEAVDSKVANLLSFAAGGRE